MVLSPEGFAAYITGVGSLVGVGALVDQQVVRLAGGHHQKNINFIIFHVLPYIY